MEDSVADNLESPEAATETHEAPQPRAVGSPLPMGAGPREPQSRNEVDPTPPPSAPPLGRSLTGPPAARPPQASPLQRAVNVLRVALPLVQRILPLLDGNIGTAVSNILTPHPPPPPPPPPPLNLAPIEESLAELHTQHRDLRDQFAEQNSSLKRVEDQLEMVREATDRNTLEQQELIEDLKSVGGKVNLVSIIALGLLTISILLNVVLYLHIMRVLP